MREVLTPEQSKAARRQLGNMSQKEVARQLGQTRTNVSWFESGRFNPDAEFVRELRRFYEAQGVAFEEAPAESEAPAAEGAEDESAGDPVGELPRRAPEVSPEPRNAYRQGLRVSPSLTDAQVDALFQALEHQEAAVEDLAPRATGDGVEAGWFTGELELDEDAEAIQTELAERLANVGILFRALQGKVLVPAAEPELMKKPHQAETHGELAGAKLTGELLAGLDRQAAQRVREALEVLESEAAA